MSLASSTRCVLNASDSVPNPSDVAVDSLGKLVAIAGENGTVAIAELGTGTVAASFEAHPGLIVRVAWAHHRFGRVFATACVNGQVGIWISDGESTKFKNAYTHQLTTPCHSIAWAPNEYGQMVAVACGDGQVVILNSRSPEMTQWDQQSFMAHGGGCHAVSWAPCAAPGTLIQLPLAVPQNQQHSSVVVPSPRLVTCGPERSIRVWRYLSQDRHWLQEQELADFPSDVASVRDVSWASNPGLPFGYIAAGTEDGQVAVWLQDGCDGRWNACVFCTRFVGPICRVSWSAAGALLLVNCSSGATLWKEMAHGQWECAFDDQK